MDLVLAGHGDQVFPTRDGGIKGCVQDRFVGVIDTCQLSPKRIADFAFSNKVKPTFRSDAIDRHEVNIVFKRSRVGNKVGDAS